MDFTLNERETYWRDRIKNHIDTYVRPRVKDYQAEQATGDRWKCCRSSKKKSARQGCRPLEPVHAAAAVPIPILMTQ
jgi:hypothetical protein